jgi:protein-disulfide isomerase
VKAPGDGARCTSNVRRTAAGRAGTASFPVQKTMTTTAARVRSVAIANLSALSAAAFLAAGAAAQESSAYIQRAAESRAKGVESAPIFVYEFADFQCPHCARFALEVFPRIDSAFVKTGKVHWVFVNLPLPNHPNAWVAHEAAVCAGAVADRFWPVHDRIFGTQVEWSDEEDPAPLFARYAKEAGVPADAFARCVASDLVATLLLQDVIFAASSRVNGTPAFNINNEVSVMGMKTYEEWKELIEKTLKKQEDR